MSLVQIKEIGSSATEEIRQATTIEDLERLRINYLGKKGLIPAQMKLLGKMTDEERKDFGQAINLVKQDVVHNIETKKKELNEIALSNRLEQEKIDVTLPIWWF